jgi:hypothetical protein
MKSKQKSKKTSKKFPEEDITFGMKLKVILFPAILFWILLFLISLCFSRHNLLENALITLGMACVGIMGMLDCQYDDNGEMP